MSESSHIFMPKDHMNKLYNSENFLVKFVNQRRLDKIADLVPKSKNKLKILDAGCGEGHLIKTMRKRSGNNMYYGIDITPVAVKATKKRCPNAKIKVGDIRKTGFKDQFFDVIVCTDVIEHIFDYKKAMNELKRVLKKDGFLIISFPNETLLTIGRIFLRRKPIKVPDHVNSFTPDRMVKEIKLKKKSKAYVPFNLLFNLSFDCIIKFRK